MKLRNLMDNSSTRELEERIKEFENKGWKSYVLEKPDSEVELIIIEPEGYHIRVKTVLAKNYEDSEGRKRLEIEYANLVNLSYSINPELWKKQMDL